MNFDLNSISAFQFNNLIQNRVPFLIINLGVDLAQQYKALEKMHIEQNSLQTTEEKALNELTSLNLHSSHALVIICQDGIKSKRLASAIEQSGFINVYVLKNGYNGLLNQPSEQI